MSTLQNWILDRQENGDDGSGYCDYCQDCGTMGHLCICAPMCGDCLVPITECGCRP